METTAGSELSPRGAGENNCTTRSDLPSWPDSRVAMRFTMVAVTSQPPCPSQKILQGVRPAERFTAVCSLLK